MTDNEIAKHWDDSNEAVAWRCKLVRTMTGLSQTAFGESVAATKELAKSWERGGSLPQRPHMKAMRERYGITSDFLLLGDWQSLRFDVWRDLKSRADRTETRAERRKEQNL